MLEASAFIFDKIGIKEDMIIGSIKPVRQIQIKNYHVADIYSKNPGFCCNSNENRVLITGTLEGVALVHPKSNLKIVKELLIKDLLFSLKNRLEITSDGYLLEENPFLKSPQHLIIQLPRRTSFILSSCTLTAYSFGDVEALQALVSILASVKPVLSDSKEQLPEAIKKIEPIILIEQKSNTKFMMSVLLIFAILVLTFIIRNIN